MPPFLFCLFASICFFNSFFLSLILHFSPSFFHHRYFRFSISIFLCPSFSIPYVVIFSVFISILNCFFFLFFSFSPAVPFPFSSSAPLSSSSPFFPFLILFHSLSSTPIVVTVAILGSVTRRSIVVGSSAPIRLLFHSSLGPISSTSFSRSAVENRRRASSTTCGPNLSGASTPLIGWIRKQRLATQRSLRSTVIISWKDADKFAFLDAPSHLYKRVCPSVRMSVRGSVR